MSRLLTTLLLEKTGYDVARYISIERLIEDNKALYYNALAASSTGWNENQNTEVPLSVSCSEQPWPPTDSSSSVP